MVKPEVLDDAQFLFADTGIQITQHGQRHLGAVIGSLSFRESYVKHKIDNWIEEIKILSSIARSHPHAAMAVFTHGLVNKWQYLMRTNDGIKHLFDPLEDAIKLHLIYSCLDQSGASLPIGTGTSTSSNPPWWSRYIL